MSARLGLDGPAGPPPGPVVVSPGGGWLGVGGPVGPDEGGVGAESAGESVGLGFGESGVGPSVDGASGHAGGVGEGRAAVVAAGWGERVGVHATSSRPAGAPVLSSSLLLSSLWWLLGGVRMWSTAAWALVAMRNRTVGSSLRTVIQWLR